MKRVERFEEGRHYRVDEHGCWVWLLSTDHAGYGQTAPRDGEYKAHRRMWASVHGAIPENTHIHHKCRNVACMNPDHLEAMSDREHIVLHQLTDKTGLSLEDLREMKTMIEDPATYSYVDIGNHFGMHPRSIYRIALHGRWGPELGEMEFKERTCLLPECSEVVIGRRNKKFCSKNHRDLLCNRKIIGYYERRGIAA